MRQLPRRAMLGATVLLCLLAGALAPAPHGPTAAAATPLPDLVVDDITWTPQNPAQGETVTFSITVRNLGEGRAEASQLECLIDDVPGIPINLSPLGPGATATGTFNWPAVAGPHNISAIIDPGDIIEESDDGNNDINFAFSVLSPDLSIESITWTPEEPEIRDPVVFTVTVKNRGDRYARASNMELFIDNASRGYYPIPALEPGANATQTHLWTAQAGTHAVTAIADVLEQVAESDEANNERTVLHTSASPDLVVSKISWTAVSSSGNTTVTVSVKNRGDGKADPCYLAYYIDNYCLGTAYLPPIAANTTVTKSFDWEAQSGAHNIRAAADVDKSVFESDETNNETTALYSLDGAAPDLVIQSIKWTPAKPLANHQIIITVVIKNEGDARAIFPRLKVLIDGTEEYPQHYTEIAAGATANRTIPWTLPPGSHTIAATADPYGEIAESEESNNTKTATVSSYNPASYALSLGEITVTPAVPEVGETVTFNIPVKNGNKALPGAFYVAYYIDSQLWATDYVGSLLANKTVAKTYDWVAQPGSHTFMAIADSNNVIPEANEADNEASLEVYVPAPDLVVEGINWTPKEPKAGDKVTYTVSIKNQGALKAARSRTAYYVDGISRGSHGLPEVNPGATATSTFTWTAEADTHTLLVVADADAALTEEDEGNNEKAVTLPAADLAIGSIAWLPAEPSGNATVHFSINVQNLGAGPASPSRMAAYIDDTLISHVTTAAVAPGASTTGNFTWKLQPGSHIFKVVADAKQQITEADETNNEKMTALHVAPTANTPVPAAKETSQPATDNAVAVLETAEPTEPDEPTEEEIMAMLTAEAEEPPPDTEALPADVEDAPATLPLIGEMPQLGSWSSLWMIGGAIIFLAAAAIVALRLLRRAKEKSPEEEEAKAAEKEKAAEAKIAAKEKKAAEKKQAAEAKQAEKAKQAAEEKKAAEKQQAAAKKAAAAQTAQAQPAPAQPEPPQPAPPEPPQPEPLQPEPLETELLETELLDEELELPEPPRLVQAQPTVSVPPPAKAQPPGDI